MSDEYGRISEALRRLEEGQCRLEAGLLPPRSQSAGTDVPFFSGKFSGPSLYDSLADPQQMGLEVLRFRAELNALAAKVLFQEQVQQDQNRRIGNLEGRSNESGRQQRQA